MQEELTLAQVDGLSDNFIVFYALAEALQYAIGRGTVYTQVDTEEDPVYVKGVHYVNRTGIYGVLERRIQQ